MGADVLYISPCCKTEKNTETKHRYYILIKSHCEAPDYEDTCEASSLEEALDMFLKTRGLRGWGKEDIRSKVYEGEAVEHKCQICGNVFDEPIKEVVDYGD